MRYRTRADEHRSLAPNALSRYRTLQEAVVFSSNIFQELRRYTCSGTAHSDAVAQKFAFSISK